MQNKLLSLLLIFSLAFNIAFVGIWAYNRTSPGPNALQAPSRAASPWERLEVAPEQRERLREQWRGLHAEVRSRRETLQRQRDRLLELMADPEPNEAPIRACRNNIERIQDEVRNLVLTHMRRMGEVLTPEQRRRMFHMLRGSHRDRTGHGMPRRMHRPGAMPHRSPRNGHDR